MSQLLTPVRIGRYLLPNRVVMAPMMRRRADDAGFPHGIVATYYAQRSTAGLIITEGVYPSAMGKGYMRTAGIVDDAQGAAWKRITDAVHANGGRIFMQLMHVGRISHPAFLPNREQPVSASAVRPAGQSRTPEGLQDYVTPAALSAAGITGVVNEFRLATRRALAAGCDGVELHGASGYLPEQFLSSGTNQRRDAFGGSVANRARFVVDVLTAMAAEGGGDRVGLKIAPENNSNDVYDATPVETYTYLVDQLRGLNLAYLYVAQSGNGVDYHDLLRPRFDGAYFIGRGLTQETAEAAIAKGRADAAVFGSAFIANPDLPERFLRRGPLNTPDKATYYTSGAEGLIDYPSLTAAAAQPSAGREL
jgi:N-ethylmaleimide reductase